MRYTRTLALAVVGTTLAIGSSDAAAQDFPSQPIEVVTHASAGGGTDTTARMALIRARRELKADAFVATKKGGGGSVAMSYVKDKPADGHTLLAITPTHLFTMARGKAPIGIDDIVGVVRTTDDPIVVMVRGDSKFKTIEDLIAAGKDRPLKWGGTQVGGVDHIAAMAFGKATGSKIAYVPFDGGGEFLTALLGGDIEVAGFNVTETKDQIEAGDVRPLAAMADNPITALPDTPTLPSKGYDVIFSTVRGFVALKDTPADRLQTLEAGMLKALNHQTFQTYLTGSGLDASSVAGQEAWDRQIRKMYTSAEATMRELGLIK
ncbi:MAG: tripartite tricarboxylate transporter substrate binding protein [Pseudomonadota bacterium]